MSKLNDFLGEDAGKSKSGPEVSAVWLEVDFIAPSGKTETVHREIFDRIGPAARLQKREATAPLAPLALQDGVPLALTGVFACSFSSGRFIPALAFARLASQSAAVRAIAPVLASGRVPTDDEARSLSGSVGTALPAILTSVAASVHIASQQSRALLRTDDLLLYEATPRLAIVSLELAPSEDGKSVVSAIKIDLRRNDLRVTSQHRAAADVIRVNIARGVLDGVIEHGILADGRPAPSPFVTSTVAVMDRAGATNTTILPITDPGGIKDLAASEAVKARMLDSLNGNATLIVPARAVTAAGVERLGWWRVDVKSGETLGITEDGLHGQEMTEYLASEVFLSHIRSFALFQLAFSITVIVLIAEAGLVMALYESVQHHLNPGAK